MFGNKYLLLELDKAEADFYHLPVYVPYLKKHQKELKEFGFEWDLAIEAMQDLIEEMDVEEYKPYKLFVRKWSHYKDLSIHIKEENWSEAEKEIDKILSIDLLDPSAYLNLGFVFRQQNVHEKAEQAYQKGLELLPKNIPFLAGLARTYEEWGKSGEAIYTWKKILDNSEENEEALNMLIKHKVYKEVKKRDPKTKKCTVKYVPDENFEKLMRKEFQKNHDDIQALTDLGLNLIQENYTKLAIKVFERVYQLSQLQNNGADEKLIPEHLKVHMKTN